MCNMHHPLFMSNMHRSRLHARQTNLNFVQIRTRPLFTCKTYPPFFYEQDVSIQILWNTDRYCIHVHKQVPFKCNAHNFLFKWNAHQFSIHGQYTICITWEIHTNIHGLYAPYSHFWVIYKILGQSRKEIRLIWNPQGNTPQFSF